MSEVRKAVMAFAEGILHGDQAHQDWLIEQAEAFCQAYEDGVMEDE